MVNHAPPGWRHNPSSFSRRARLASLAAIAASLVLILDVPSPESQTASAFVTLAIGAMHLIGGSHRWGTKPWYVLALAIVAIPISFTQTGAFVLTYADADRSDLGVLAYVGLVFILGGAALDELLASAQMLRRHYDRGRSTIRAFFGLRRRR